MIRTLRAAGGDDLPSRMARGMLWTALILLFVMRAVHALENGFSGAAVALGAASYPPLIALLLRRRRSRRGVRYGLLGGVTVLALLPFALVGTDWGWLPWTVAAAVLCVCPQRVAWPLFVLVIAATFGGEALIGAPFADCFWQATATATDGLIVFSLYALAEMVDDLHAARSEQARLALVRERLRLDGELRGALDEELAAIAGRLRGAVGAAPRTALAEVTEATAAARRALAGIRATASRYRTRADPAAVPVIGSPRPARAALVAVIVLQSTKNLVYMVCLPGGDARWLIAAVPLVACVMLLLTWRRSPVRWLVAWALFVPLVWAVCFSLPTVAYLTNLWGFVMGAALVTFRPPRSWAVAAGLLVMHAVFFHAPPPVPRVVDQAGLLVSDLILAWLFASLSRLADLVAVLERARHEVAGAVAAAERLRVARDLHDVLGFTLSAVALRGELAARLLDRDPDRADAELTALGDLVERSRTELGSITGGRVRLRLDRELDAAVDVLTTAGISVRAQGDAGPRAEAVDTALAAVLRECVTNVLRHSEARTCTITVTRTDGTIRLKVVNDGARPARGEPGSGLAGLAERTGGRLAAGSRPGGRFEVTAEFAAGSPEPCSEPARLPGDADGVDAVAGV
ncbi:sensor histidine kinase [Actinomadura verrucosospora]|nr:histidine kinase [Actinomadura verrucosospora]